MRLIPSCFPPSVGPCLASDVADAEAFAEAHRLDLVTPHFGMGLSGDIGSRADDGRFGADGEAKALEAHHDIGADPDHDARQLTGQVSHGVREVIDVLLGRPGPVIAM